MNSAAYSLMLEQMEAGTYTEVEAKETLDSFLAYKRITKEEYEELMEKASGLATNSEDGQTLARIVALESAVKTLREQVDAIKQAVEQGGTTVIDPEQGQTGNAGDPIDACKGMYYEKDKYYRDPTNKEVYVCTVSVAYAGLPHEAVNVYFNWARKE